MINKWVRVAFGYQLLLGSIELQVVAYMNWISASQSKAVLFMTIAVLLACCSLIVFIGGRANKRWPEEFAVLKEMMKRRIRFICLWWSASAAILSTVASVVISDPAASLSLIWFAAGMALVTAGVWYATA